jgi:hypothetical protein
MPGTSAIMFGFMEANNEQTTGRERCLPVLEESQPVFGACLVHFFHGTARSISILSRDFRWISCWDPWISWDSPWAEQNPTPRSHNLDLSPRNNQAIPKQERLGIHATKIRLGYHRVTSCNYIVCTYRVL